MRFFLRILQKFFLTSLAVLLIVAAPMPVGFAASRSSASSMPPVSGSLRFKKSYIAPRSSSSRQTSVRVTKKKSSTDVFVFPFNNTWKEAWNFYVVKTIARATFNKHKSGKSNHGEVFDSLDLSRVNPLKEEGGEIAEFMRVQLPKGAGSPFTTHFYSLPPSGVTALACGSIVPSDDMVLRYDVLFPKEFDFSSTGGLPGIVGGILNQVEGTHSLSYFGVWMGWDRLGFIEYGGFRDELGVTRVSTTKFSADGKWHKVEIAVRSNVPPLHKMNGSVEIRYDGKALIYVQRAAIRKRDQDRFECYSFIVFAGGLDTITNLSKDSFVDIGGIAVSGKPMW